MDDHMKVFPDEAWSAWHPSDLKSRLRTEMPWYVVGGWALDLWHGVQTRPHEDLEFAVSSAGVDHFRRLLNDLEFFAVDNGRFEHLPLGVQPPGHVMQLWGADRKAGCWRVDMMLERGTPDIWAYKRDPAIHAPRTEIIRKTADGIPYLAPAAVLLFKAKYRREKDEQDFSLAVPKLNTSEKVDLRRWLEKAHPGHGWISML
jgi:hypothetical protein